ncbi:MAG: DUF2917 domain-containing protein [Desulfosarcinaceae bacterium]|nr:DUF2917 domain-containing protein [Desulfosarcinaceae bacterium]
MRYSLAQDQVIWVQPGRSGVSVRCLRGKIWLTKTADRRDYAVAQGDRLHVEAGVKAALMAAADSRLIIEGRRFRLFELRMGDGPRQIHQIEVRQSGEPARPYPRKRHPAGNAA